MQWVQYVGPPQSFALQNLTRDGDWTMVANKATSDRPAPQASGAEMDLLPAWTPTTQSAPATYVVYNEWTLSSSGWIDQYGVDILAANTGATHILTLRVNGVIKDTFTSVPNAAGIYWHDITPIVALSGAVVRVTLQVTRSGSNSWFQQTGLFATAPTYCSLAVGSKDGATAGTTAYGCHLLFTPGAASPDWDVVAYGGEAAGGSVADVTSWNGRTGAVTLTPADVRAVSTGVIDGSNAAAGQIGEYVSFNQPGIGGNNGVWETIGSIVLSAGDWDVVGFAQSVCTGGAITTGAVGIGLTGAASPIATTQSQITVVAAAGMTVVAHSTGVSRQSLTTNTTIYLNIYIAWSAGTVNNVGLIQARRVR
jgi:hypothetical protein